MSRRHIHKANYERERRKRLGQLFAELNLILEVAGFPRDRLANQVDSLIAAISLLNEKVSADTSMALQGDGSEVRISFQIFRFSFVVLVVPLRGQKLRNSSGPCHHFICVSIIMIWRKS